VNLNCKPGDIAICISGTNQGALVEVKETFAVTEIHGHVWLCIAMSRVKGRLVDRTMRPDLQERPVFFGPGDRVVFRDSVLRPLRGDPTETGERDDLELHEPTGTEVLT